MTRLIQRTEAVSEGSVEYEYEYRDAEYEYEKPSEDLWLFRFADTRVEVLEERIEEVIDYSSRADLDLRGPDQ